MRGASILRIGLVGAFLGLFVVLTQFVSLSHAQDSLEEKKKEIEALQAKLTEIQGQKQTLAKTIEYLNTKIVLTQKQIERTEAEITVLESEVQSLTGKITVLDSNLGKLSSVLVNRINLTYKKSSVEPMYLLLSSDGFGEFMKKYKYTRVGQKHDKKVMYELEKARTNFNEQKVAKEEKQVELEVAKKRLTTQRASLNQQQQEKSILLQVTRNDEKKYQEMVARAKAELEAIQAVISGKGTETEVKNVSEGDSIASVIVGASACSTGTHLHFEVVRDAKRVNPFSVLKSTSLIWDNADPESNGSGSWLWPIPDPVRVTQSFGQTSYSSRYAGNFHTGIDIVNDSGNMDVKSVRPGTLFRGAIKCGSGTLRYVRVKHDDGYDSYYLHVNY